MPKTATKGTRSKFYNELARDARQLDTIRLPSTHVENYPPSLNPSRMGGSQSNYSQSQVNRSIDRANTMEEEEEDDDDGGWGSIPASAWGGNPTPSERASPHHSNTDTRQRAEDRAYRVAKNDSHNTSIPTQNTKGYTTKRARPHTHTHTPTSKEKVKSWISSSRDITPRNTIINRVTHSASSSSLSRSPSGRTDNTPPNLNRSRPREKQDKMNYLQEDLPGLSSSYRRYLPPDSTDPLRDTYRTFNSTLPESRHQTFSPRILENARLRSPLSLSDLHPTNPFSSNNLPSYRGREGETMNSSNNAEILEKERQAALQRAQELQRRIEDNKRAQGIPQRAGDNQEIRALQHEIDHLQTKVREYRDISLAHQNRIHELETQNTTQVHASHPAHHHAHNDNSASLMGEVIELKSEIDRLNKNISDLTDLLHSKDREVEEERDKRLRADLEADSSKKGQSHSAKLLDTSENKVKNLENQLKESQERERLARVGQSALEKKVKGFDQEKLFIQKDLETWRSKAMTAYREKEGAIAKYRGKEHDNAKLSDKLNLSRREKEALQARLDEVLNEVAQSAEKSEFEKASLVDRRKIKEELIRERATSDRLRNERNTYREQIKALKIQLNTRAKRSTESKAEERVESKGIISTVSELHHPTPTSPDKHRPRFSLDPLDPVTHSTATASEAARREGDHEGDQDGHTIEEVIEDTDGTEYTSQRVKLQDGSNSVDVHNSEISRSSDVTPRNDNTTSNYTSDIQSLLPPKLTMDSLPLQPRKKVDTPSKEEISLFSPSTSFVDSHSRFSSYNLNPSDTNSTIRPGDSISNIIKNTEKGKGKDKDKDEEEKRRKWLTRYAELSDLKDDSSWNRITDTSRVDSMDEKAEKVIVDPFADLDPLESNKSFSPNSSSTFSPKSTSLNITATSEPGFRSQPQEQTKKANQQSLMDLLSSPARH